MPNWFRSLIRLATANMQVTLTLISLHPMQNKIPNGWDLVEYQVLGNLNYVCLCYGNNTFPLQGK